MAYIPDNLSVAVANVGGAMPRTFVYLNNPADTNAAIIAAGFFSNFRDMGGKVGDLVIGINLSPARKTEYQCTAINAAGAATVAVPTAV